jgi:hypothetical protein
MSLPIFLINSLLFVEIFRMSETFLHFYRLSFFNAIKRTLLGID